jgi:beta-lactamase regulating signal transducer with metallopeptidase domain
MSADAVLSLVAGNMVWATLAMLLVLAVRRPFAALFGAVPAYALWLLPVLRLVAPPLPAWQAEIPVELPPQNIILFVGDAAAPLPPQGGPGQWVPWMLAIWALGAAAFIVWQWVAYRRFLAALDLDARALGDHQGLPLVESAAAQGPLALGLLRRRIVVPADFETRYSAAERRLALDHESVHHRRGDIWWNHVGLIVLALNWFNPIAWLAFRAFRADQELACDAAVAAAATPDARHDYARALIKSASRPGLVAACPLNHAAQLKRRLKMMKFHKASRGRMLGGAVAIAVLAGIGLSVGGPGFAQPTPPAPPVPPAAGAAPAAPHDGTRRERVVVRTITRDGREETTTTRVHGDGDAHGGDRERHEHVIVMTHRGDGQGEGHGESRSQGHGEGSGHGDSADHHRMMMMHPGGGMAMVMPHCDHGSADIDEESGDANNRSRVVICGGGDATPAQRAERLQRARDRLAGDSELSAEQRARVLALLDQQIARLRGQ